METLARPKPGARDGHGRLINFALIDADVAPDGSLFLSDHNQGIWRIYFGDQLEAVSPGNGIERGKLTKAPVRAALSPGERPDMTRNRAPDTPRASGLRERKNQPGAADLVQQLLSLPQPAAEWSRLREESIRSTGGSELQTQLQLLAANRRKPLDQRLKAIRFLFASFAELPESFIKVLAGDRTPEIRSQAAHLLGIREPQNGVVPLIERLLNDSDPFVRRRAAEALTRITSSDAVPRLITRLADSSRAVRHTSMIALAHHPTALFFSKAARKREPEIRMRALVAAHLRGELPANDEILAVIEGLLAQRFFPEEELDLLRVLGIFRKLITNAPALNSRLSVRLASQFPAVDREIRWEQVRLIGDFRATNAFPDLLRVLEAEKDEVTQFHLVQALVRLPGGWNAAEEERLFAWIAKTQKGWFADFMGKGVEFPQFWLTTLSDFADHHQGILLQHFAQIDGKSLLGTAAIEAMGRGPEGPGRLMAFYERDSDSDPAVRLKVVSVLANKHQPEVRAFCRTEYGKSTNAPLQGAFLKALAGQSSDPADAPRFFAGLNHAESDVVRSCVTALVRIKPPLSEPDAISIIRRMDENSALCKTVEPLLIQLSGEKLSPPPERLTDAIRATRIQFWKSWYEQKFAKLLIATAAADQKTDPELIDFLLSDRARGGDRVRGGTIYETLQCNTCHGGGITPGREGRLFGPDLAGVTRRLSPREFAESLVYPSRQVADRYKAYEVTLHDETILAGFITEQNDAAVTIADREQIHRLARAQIKSIRSQAALLMPDHLLNGLTWEQIRDLLAFLDDGSGAH